MMVFNLEVTELKTNNQEEPKRTISFSIFTRDGEVGGDVTMPQLLR